MSKRSRVLKTKPRKIFRPYHYLELRRLVEVERDQDTPIYKFIKDLSRLSGLKLVNYMLWFDG